MVFTSSMHDFSPRNKLKITVVRAIFYFAFANLALGSKPHEAACSKSRVESTDLHCILTTNINKCRRGGGGGGNDEEEKMTDRRLGKVYSSYHAGVSLACVAGGIVWVRD